MDLLFIGGLHRSGTTLLQRLVAAHPDVSGLSATGVPEDEGQHLQDVFPAARDCGGPGRFAFDPRMHLDETAARAEHRSRLLAAWQPFWQLDRRVLVEKSPPNMLKMRYLHQVFPEAKFVVVVRDPIAVSIATRRRFAADASMHDLLRHWAHAHRLMRADAERLGDAVLTLRYEDLVSAPARTVSMVWDLVGASPHEVLAPVRSGINAEYLETWHRKSRWHRTLLRARFGWSARSWGYQLPSARSGRRRRSGDRPTPHRRPPTGGVR
jgi:hypothetical protein